MAKTSVLFPCLMFLFLVILPTGMLRSDSLLLHLSYIQLCIYFCLCQKSQTILDLEWCLILYDDFCERFKYFFSSHFCSVCCGWFLFLPNVLFGPF